MQAETFRMNGKNERDFRIAVAGHSVAVHALHTRVFSLCKEYLTDLAPDMEISVTESDLESERQEAKKSRSPQQNDAYMETLAVSRKIREKMLAYDPFLMHGAVIAVGERAWLFTAASGTGKTTHIRLWLDQVPGSYVVNGDKPLIRAGDPPIVYGTPWAGKEGMFRDTGVPLCGIVLLERGTVNSIEPIALPQALPLLIQQTYRPADRASLARTLTLLGDLASRVPLYRLRCDMRPEAALTAYAALGA